MSKFRPPTQHNGVLRRTHLEVLIKTKNLLDECKRDPERWCAKLGIELIRTNGMLVPPIRCVIFGQKIFIAKGLTSDEEIWFIAHEYAHMVFHAATTAYKHLDVLRINRDEREANAFADMILNFSL